MANDTVHDEHGSLNLQDLLLDESNDVLSESVSPLLKISRQLTHRYYKVSH